MKIRNVVLAGHVPMSAGMQCPKDLAGDRWQVTVLEEHFPWVHIYDRDKKAEGMTTIFNIVGRGVEPLDKEKLAALNAPSAPAPDASKQAPPAKRGG